MVNIRELTIDDYDALCALWEEAGLPFKLKFLTIWGLKSAVNADKIRD